MTKVKIAELRDHLSEHLRAVEQGGEVVVTDRDRPIARIVPFTRSRKKIRIKKATKSFKEVRNRRYPPANWKISSTELLLEERQER